MRPIHIYLAVSKAYHNETCVGFCFPEIYCLIKSPFTDKIQLNEHH